MTRTAQIFTTTALSSLLLLAGLPSQAQSQESGLFLGRLVFSGNKRVEDLMRLPQSATVLDWQSLAAPTIEPGAEIARRTPGVVFSGFGQPGTEFVNLRGIGALGYPLSADDSTVAYAFAGVPTTNFGFPPMMLDTERVEVLRGPQGTMFGRNGLGGAIDVVPRGADGTPERRVTLEAGSDGLAIAELVAGGWIVEDRLAARAALRFERFGGDIPNVIAGGTEGGHRLATGRLTLAGQTDDGWELSLLLQAERQRRHSNYTMLYEAPGFPVSGSDVLPLNTRDGSQAILRAERDFEGFRFTSLTSVQNMRLIGDVDGSDSLLFAAFTGLPPDVFTDPTTDYTRMHEDQRIVSQELRIAALEGAAISWVAGVNWLRSAYTGHRVALNSTNLYSNGTSDVAITGRSASAFADLTLPLGSRARLTAGLRYSRDSQSLDARFLGNGYPGTVASYAQSDSISDTSLTGRLALAYDFTPALMGFVGVSTGYAAGGYERLVVGAATGTPTEAFRPSHSRAFEAGLRHQSEDGRARTSVTLFRNEVRDGQLFDYEITGTGIRYFFTNQDYVNQGIEFEGEYALGAGFTLRGGLGLLDSEMVDAPLASGRNGNRVPLAAQLTANLGIEYRRDLGAGELLSAIDWAHVGARQSDVANSWELPSYSTVNARLALERGGLSLYAFANNLTDTRPILFGSTYTPDAHSVSLGRGRVVGLGLTRRF